MDWRHASRSSSWPRPTGQVGKKKKQAFSQPLSALSSLAEQVWSQFTSSLSAMNGYNSCKCLSTLYIHIIPRIHHLITCVNLDAQISQHLFRSNISPSFFIINRHNIFVSIISNQLRFNCWRTAGV